jgi:mannan endo-1,4-beta-mannosidase
MKNKILLTLFVSVFFACNQSPQKAINTTAKNNFVTVSGNRFMINNKPYYFVGTNFWAGMNLGANTNSGNQGRLIRELDKMKSLGITNIRIMALTEGPDNEPFRIVPSMNNNGVLNEDYLKGLDFLLTEMGKRNLYAVVCLTNFWPWSGGMAQYQKWSGAINNIHYPMTQGNSWDTYMKSTAKFYSNKIAIDKLNSCIAKIVTRYNSITHIAYKNDPTIMSWELCNEPRGIDNVNAYLAWINNTAQYIKKLDANHLVTVGSEGTTPYESYSGTPFEQSHASKYIDYTCIHLWVQNWEMYNPKKHNETIQAAKQKSIDYINKHIAIAKKMNKPFVLEEFGIMKDNGSYNPNATNYNRDNFYTFIFNEIANHINKNEAAGVNFWAWAGEGRPKQPGNWWQPGNDFTGDPPHEEQGWYSVYNTDYSTHLVIKKYADAFNAIR